MRFHELFPELAMKMVRDLRALKRTDLVEQLMSLMVVDRCRCGAEVCEVEAVLRRVRP
jgi:hypothetical protein